jgi:hypothetical protein
MEMLLGLFLTSLGGLAPAATLTARFGAEGSLQQRFAAPAPMASQQIALRAIKLWVSA